MMQSNYLILWISKSAFLNAHFLMSIMFKIIFSGAAKRRDVHGRNKLPKSEFNSPNLEHPYGKPKLSK